MHTFCDRRRRGAYVWLRGPVQSKSLRRMRFALFTWTEDLTDECSSKGTKRD